jgi:hypothetical protein
MICRNIRRLVANGFCDSGLTDSLEGDKGAGRIVNPFISIGRKQNCSVVSAVDYIPVESSEGSDELSISTRKLSSNS